MTLGELIYLFVPLTAAAMFILVFGYLSSRGQ